MKKLTTQDFIKQAKKVHGDKYDYNKTIYNGRHSKLNIVCPIHGTFEQEAGAHLNGSGCQKCAKNFKYSTQDFIEQAKKVHGDKYDYNKVDYVNSQTKVCITCPKHGDFWQEPTNHLRGYGCPKCRPEEQSVKFRNSTQDFIKQAKKVHGDKYDYNKVDYVNNRTEVEVICPKHGIFLVTPNRHLANMAGCPKCNMTHGETKIKNFLETNNINFEYNKGVFDWLVYKRKMRPDFWLPDYNLVIEYDGEYHYTTRKRKSGLLLTKKRDEKKDFLLKEHGIDILRIPYWEQNNIENVLTKRLVLK